MAKQSKQQAVGMGRNDLEAGGFLNDRACRIDEAEATLGTSKSGKGGERAVVRILMTVEGMEDQVERNLSVGKGLIPADDGSRFYPEPGGKAKGVKKSSNYGRFLESLYEADTDEKIDVQQCSDLAGVIFRALEIEEPPITEGDPPRRILTVAEILEEMPDSDEKPKKGKKPTKAAKDEDEDDEETEDEDAEEDDDTENETDPVNAAAKEIIEELLSEKSPRKIDTLPALVLRAAAGNKKRKEIVAQVQNAKWLAATFTVNKAKGTVAEAE